MKVLNLFIFTFVFLNVVSLNAQTTSLKKPDQVIEMDMKKYIDFIIEWTSYKYKGEPLPVLKITKHELVQIFAYGDFEYAQAESKGDVLSTVNAVYDRKRKTIYISDKLDLNDPKSEITLVHELVHYLQDINGYTESVKDHLACTESEAYDVQMMWQTIQQVDVESVKDVYLQSLFAAMKCMGSKSSSFKSHYEDFTYEQEYK